MLSSKCGGYVADVKLRPIHQKAAHVRCSGQCALGKISVAIYLFELHSINRKAVMRTTFAREPLVHLPENSDLKDTSGRVVRIMGTTSLGLSQKAENIDDLAKP